MLDSVSVLKSFEQISQLPYLTDMYCNGRESNLLECPHNVTTASPLCRAAGAVCYGICPNKQVETHIHTQWQCDAIKK